MKKISRMSPSLVRPKNQQIRVEFSQTICYAEIVLEKGDETFVVDFWKINF